MGSMAVFEGSGGVSLGASGTEHASEALEPASDVDDAALEGRGRAPLSTRSPGMHLGHDLLLAVMIAVGLLATLLLYAGYRT